jgi:F0F1-type ATP synthase assembly protein I
MSEEEMSRNKKAKTLTISFVIAEGTSLLVSLLGTREVSLISGIPFYVATLLVVGLPFLYPLLMTLEVWRYEDE